MITSIYGDAFIALGFKFVDAGCPEELHDIYEWAVQHRKMKPYHEWKHPHPLNVHQAVLNGLDRDDRFEKYFINYRGIPGPSVRVFQLKKEAKKNDKQN